MIIADAHAYLLEHYKEFDFIWSSPPCQTHSDIRRCGVHKGQYNALYIDNKLWEEIILLQHYAKGKYVVENVKPYYKPFVAPKFELERHLFWSNFYVPQKKFPKERIHGDIIGSSTVYGICINKYIISNKRQILRNMVNPEVAKYILDVALEIKDYKQPTLL